MSSSNPTGPSAALCSPPDQVVTGPGGWVRSETSQARAGYGVLGVEGRGTIVGNEFGTSTTATATFGDELFFTSATAFTGFLEVSDVINGVVLITGTGSYDVATNNPAENAAYFLLETGDSDGDGSSGNQRVTASPFQVSLTIPISSNPLPVNGVYTAYAGIQADLTTATFCQLTGPGSKCSVLSDFFDTSRITGVTVLGSNGQPLDVTITSASGTNYNDIPGDTPSPSAVPEPSNIALFGSGLVGMLGMVRRRVALRRI